MVKILLWLLWWFIDFFIGRAQGCNQCCVYLDEMFLPESKKTITRLPDRPRLEDLESIGLGHDDDSYNENRNGIILLDECASWLNVRSWSDKSRAHLVERLRYFNIRSRFTVYGSHHPRT